jgi:predicted CopG family antitoxin
MSNYDKSKLIRIDNELYNKLKSMKIYSNQTFNSVLYFYLKDIDKFKPKRGGKLVR